MTARKLSRAMQILNNPDQVDSRWKGCVLTVGNFDGVHLGHRRLLARARTVADNRPVVAMTFEPHPISVLAPHRAPLRLTPPREKLDQLSTTGVDAVMVLNTTPDLLSTAADEFVRRYLVEPFAPIAMVEGPNFGFGAGRSGSVDTLKALGPVHGFTVDVVDPLQFNSTDDARTVSSSSIRSLLLLGDVAAAAEALGRPYALLGTVVHGKGKGRTLGYPTINLSPEDQLIPADGVYAGFATTGSNHRILAAISIGTRPTFNDTARSIEAFLLDFDGDLYESAAKIELCHTLRPQQRFDSPDELATQIARDVESVRQLLGGSHS